MNRRNIFLAIMALIAVLVIVKIAGFVFTKKEAPEVSPEKTPQSVPVREKEMLKMGVGWSDDNDEKNAVKQAVEMMTKELENNPPNFLIVYSETRYDNKIISEELNKLLGPDIKIYGWTSLVGSVTPEGIHPLSILGFSSSRLKVGVGGCSLEETSYPYELSMTGPGEGKSREEVFNSAREAAKRATQRALEDAGESAERKPRFVLISGATYLLQGTLKNPIEERYIEGVESVVGKDVPIIGGLAADSLAQGNEKVFVNDKVYDFGSVSVAVVYTDLKVGLAGDIRVGYSFLGGFTPTTKKATVTRAEGHLLYELDGRPCAEVYDEWTEGALGERINTTEWVIDYTALHPLSEKISEEGRVPGYYNKLIHYFNNPEKGLCKVACEVEEGDVLYLLEGTPNMFVNRGALTARLARAEAQLSRDEIAGGYMVFCAGCFLAIDPEDYPRISNAINDALGGAPFIGGYEFGGFGSFLGVKENVYTTQMCSFLIFGKN